MTETLPTYAELAEEEQQAPRERHGRPMVRAAARGVIASMAMSGLRQLTISLGLVGRTPPESVIQQAAPRFFHQIPVERRQAVVEMIHWLYGAGGGAAFGLLPRSMRARPWAGPLYGVLAWAAFETGIAPALGLPRPRNTAAERLALLADHVLYGAIVAASPWPHEDR
jgi:hypothetical protein